MITDSASGVRGVDADILWFSSKDLKDATQDCQQGERERRAEEPKLATTTGWSHRFLETLRPRSEADAVLRPYAGYAGWALRPYNDLLFKLRYADERPPDAPSNPYLTIAAVSSEKAVAGIYINKRIVFLELTIISRESQEPHDRSGSVTPASKAFGGLPSEDSVIGPLMWKNHGSADTDIDTWSTSCWIDDALHLVSDDGKYERFIIKDDKVVRAGQLKDLGAPAAICQGKSHLWVLTEENEGAFAAQEITWNQEGEPAKTKRDLGRVTLDAAAVQVLAAE